MTDCNECAEYGSDFCAQCLEERKVQEDAPANATGNVASAPTAVFKTYRVTDKRRKKNAVPRILKRFKEYTK